MIGRCFVTEQHRAADGSGRQDGERTRVSQFSKKEARPRR